MKEQNDQKKAQAAALNHQVKEYNSQLNADGSRPIRFSYEEHSAIVEVRKPVR